MNTRSKTGLDILKVALGIGILADVLLRQTPWGLNVLLFNLAFVGGTTVLLWRRKPEYLTTQTWALLGAQVFFAAMFVWRDSFELRFADSVAIVVVMSVLFVPQMKIPPRVAGVFHFIVGFIWSTLNAFFGSFVLLFSDIEWKVSDRTGWSKNFVAVIRGLLIVTPLILIFGGLFVAADAAYEGLVNRVLNFDPSIIFSHAILMAIFGWATAGYLRCIILGREPGFAVNSDFSIDTSAETKSSESQRDGDTENIEQGDMTGANATVRERASTTSDSRVEALKSDSGEHAVSLPNNATILEHINRTDEAETRPLGSVPGEEEKPEDAKKEGSKPWTWASVDNSLIPNAFTLGTVEIGVVLGLIDLLFLSFVVVQIPYLFGGMDLVQNTPDFKLAEYARRGFGELVAVSALVLPVLLIGHWLIQKENRVAQKLFRGLASIQIILLFVIMASAVQRLVILTGPLGYGMTTVRLYPMIFMTWLGVVFVWFALTVLRNQRKYFAWGALWSAFFILAAAHVLNPDAYIVRTNIELMKQGREFDAGYNADLSQDAVPAILNSISDLSDRDQCIVRMTLWGRFWSRHEQDANDIRSWNLSRSNAKPFLIENTKILGYEPGSVPHDSKCSESSMWKDQPPAHD